MTPERLQNSVELMALLLSLQVRDLLRCIAFDEAHCISEMGHDYRPAYLSLEALLRRFRGIPVLAMTATANDDVQADIRMQLGLQDPVGLGLGFGSVRESPIAFPANHLTIF